MVRRSFLALRVAVAAALVFAAGCGPGTGSVYPLTPPAGQGGIWTPPERCFLPFDAGQCLALVPVYAYVGGACVRRTYGGCDGNENRFRSREECLATCEGRPDPNPCPLGSVPREICLACGPVGGCAQHGRYCAQLCNDASDCELNRCHEGVCQAYGCE